MIEVKVTSPAFLSGIEIINIPHEIYTFPSADNFRVINKWIIDFVNNMTLLVDVTCRRDMCFFVRF
ncbi:hypothetical protein ES703_81239 [subsurface metagenome]